MAQSLPFEEPFWSGKHPLTDDPEEHYPLPFGEAALEDFFGYQLEGLIDPSPLQPESIPLSPTSRKSLGGSVV